MKNSIFFILLLFSSCAIIQKGETSKKADVPEYKSLEEFKGDTISYMIQSFYERKDQYIGKKVKVFVKDLELNIIDYIPGYDPRNMLSVPSLSLCLIEKNKLSTEDTIENKPMRFYIEFETGLSSEAVFKLGEKNNWKWTKEEYKFYKDFIIKDIGIPRYGVFKSYFE